MAARRVAAVFFPQLLLELAAAAREDAPRAVALKPGRRPRAGGAEVVPHARLAQVDGRARGLGLRPGLTVAAARAMAPALQVAVVFAGEARACLEGLAEAALVFSPGVEVAEPDALLMELTGTAALFGGEEAWAHGVLARLAVGGHRARLALADGPGVALALARHGPRSPCLLPQGGGAAALRELPAAALGFGPVARQWLAAAGLRTVADLQRQPRDALARRLGAEAPRLRLLEVGTDTLADARPLRPHQPPARLAHGVEFADTPVEDVEPLVFCAKRAVDALAARLAGRQLAARELVLSLVHVPAPHAQPVADTRLQLPLALPLWLSADLLGALRPLLERTVLPAPVRSLRLEIPATTERPPVQVDAVDPATADGSAPGLRARPADPDGLPRLWAELVAELGADRVGLLGLSGSHRPEDATRLSPPGLEEDPPGPRKPARPPPSQVWMNPALCSPWFPDRDPPPPPPEGPASPLPLLPPAPARAGHHPLRVLATPRLLAAWPRRGQPLHPGGAVVRDIRPARRLWTEWWRQDALQRDYQEVTLADGAACWVFVEPHSGRAYLQGWLD
ncbi:MAG: DNA polymerase Y family protein [Deltaproteobacteria bacterium]|nr:DNA polymerase Y family protein [Deltaproteobacteria bacterium]